MGKKNEVKIIYEACCPTWMLTFGDCMSLLLCFFVMLMTFSTTEAAKLSTVLGSFQGAFGIIQPPTKDKNRNSIDRPDSADGAGGEVSAGQKEQLKVNTEDMSSVRLRDMKVKNRYSDFKESLTTLGFKNIVTTQNTLEGIESKILFSDLFKGETNELKPNATKWFGALEGLSGSMGNELRLKVCFSPDSQELRGSGMSPYEIWSLFRKRLDVIYFVLNKRYLVPSGKISFAYCIIAPGEKPYLAVLLADKFTTNEVSFNELLNSNQL